MAKKSKTPLLSPKFSLALQFANEIHGRQVRKGIEAPYISHLMAVSALVLEHGGTEAEAIAALLHDSAEDCGGKPMLDTVRLVFGDEVAAIVESCTDSLAENPENKLPWKVRKEAYVKHLAESSPSVKLVAGCDKLHNLSATIRDLLNDAPIDYWTRFKVGAVGMAWYYGACANALSNSPASMAFNRSYAELLEILKSRGDL